MCYYFSYSREHALKYRGWRDDGVSIDLMLKLRGYKGDLGAESMPVIAG